MNAQAMRRRLKKSLGNAWKSKKVGQKMSGYLALDSTIYQS